MKKALTPEEEHIRADKLLLWLEWANDRYESLLSREESSSAPSGFAEPRVVKVRNTDGQLVEVVEVDPYSLDVHVGIQVNESEASRRAHEQARTDSQLRVLERNERVRAGLESLPDRALSAYLRVQRKPHGYHKIVRGLELLRITRPVLYERLPSYTSLRAVVILMHRMVPGRFPDPPDV